MIAGIAAFLGTRWGRRIGLGLAAAILLAGVLLALRGRWIALGKQDARAADTQEEKKVWLAEREALLGELKRADTDGQAAERREKEAIAARKEAALLAQRFAAAVQEIRGQRREAARSVETTPEADRERAIIQELGFRSQDSGTKIQEPGFTPPELKALQQCVLDYPLCQKQVGELGQQVQALSREMAALEKQVEAASARTAAVEERSEALSAYVGTLEGHYARAYNAIPRRRGFKGHVCGIFTFYLKCKPSRIELPSPRDLGPARP